MPGQKPPQRISNLERRILRALCSLANARERQSHELQLADYSWQEPEHRIVYEALRRLRAADAKTWRDELPAEATRMGFPDVDWKIYFAAKTARAGDLAKWIAELKGRIAKRP